MFLLNAYGASQTIVDATYSTPKDTGVKLTCSHFEGYSPTIGGFIRTETSDTEGDIRLSISVSASSSSLLDNIKITHNGADFAISTGGLSFLGSTGTRINIEVTIYLPKDSGDVTLEALELPIIAHSMPRCGDIVLASRSGSIEVHNIEARSLAVRTRSGSISFERSGQLQLERSVRVDSGSGSARLLSYILAPKLQVEIVSGSIAMETTTGALDLAVKSRSGTISADINFTDGQHGSSIFENTSGSIRAQMHHWSGFLTAKTRSGSKHIKGEDLEHLDGGWRRGTGQSEASFETRSGSINVLID